jgi:hypothetical protein
MDFTDFTEGFDSGSEEFIRVIREIRGKIFAKMSDFAGLQSKVERPQPNATDHKEHKDRREKTA